MRNEVWLPVNNYPDYSISTFGQVFSRYKGGRMLRLRNNNFGYLGVRLSKNGKLKELKVHRLVVETFIGDCPKGMECNHKDGIKSNNRLDNLEWVTRGDNLRHAYKNGLASRVGEKNTNFKLTENHVREIRKLYISKKHSQSYLARKFGVKPGQIWKIVHKRCWRHLK